MYLKKKPVKFEVDFFGLVFFKINENHMFYCAQDSSIESE